jgi:ribonuclease P protein component
MKVLQEVAGRRTANVFQPLREATVSGATQVKFPRTARLLKHADFRRVYEQGRRHFSTNLTAFYLAHPDAVGPRIGFTVSRALGGAVDRNRMKRRLREATREAWNGFAASVDVVVNPKKTVLRSEFATLVEEMQRALAVVEKQVAAGLANPRPAEVVSRERQRKPRAGKEQR